jgi:hypothetical protein
MSPDFQENEQVLKYALRNFGVDPSPHVAEISAFFCELLKTQGGLIVCVDRPTEQMIKNACYHNVENLKHVRSECFATELIEFLIDTYPNAPAHFPKEVKLQISGGGFD